MLCGEGAAESIKEKSVEREGGGGNGSLKSLLFKVCLGLQGLGVL